MATVSFNKNFVVSNPTAIKMISEDIANPRYVEIKKRDLKVEKFCHLFHALKILMLKIFL